MGMPGPVELFVLFVLLLVIGIVVLLVLRGGGQGSGGNSAGEDLDARQILDERYARGELNRDEHEQMRGDIETE
jgi:putative membrane protein